MGKTFDKIDIVFIVLISIYLFALVIGLLWIILDKLEKMKVRANLSINNIKEKKQNKDINEKATSKELNVKPTKSSSVKKKVQQVLKRILLSAKISLLLLRKKLVLLVKSKKIIVKPKLVNLKIMLLIGLMDI